ncbi:MAG TPA: c-type cytochrome, partial [Pirellulaceae bacterium]|nr:c-type cytochrome [Pirellulaceae bacterium]
LGVTVALRKLRSPLLAEFLRDGDEHVVLEAARGIHDEPIEAALPALAAVPLGPASSDALARRVVNASYRTGEANGAARLAGVAARGDLPEALRLEALKGLGEWNSPPTRDRVLNIYRPLAKRPGEPAAAALKELLPQILARQDKAGLEGAKLAARLGIGDVGPALVKLFEDLQLPAASRAEALKALLALKDSRIETFARAALTDKQPLVRAAGLELLAELKPQESLPLLEQAAASLDRVERQAALATLGAQKKLDADPVLARAFERLQAGEVPADSRLDLLDALAARKSPAMDKLLAEFENARPKDDPLAKFAETLVGGDARRGAAVFFERAQVSCVRCHRVDGRGGDVGPDLSKIGGEKNRPYLLESIVLPNKTIAKNFESVLIVDNDGRTFSGIVKADNDQHLQLMTAEGKLLTIAKSAIDERREGK